MFKKFFASTLSIALMLAFITPAVNATEATAASKVFPDVESSDYFFDAVEDLSAREILAGYEDGTFRPNQPVTREQAAKIISLAIGLDTENVKNPGFNDVKESDYFYDYIAALANEGILEGHGDGSFKPQDTLTRAQIAKILSKGFKLGEEKLGDNAFKDVKESDWFSIYLPALIENKITLGKTADYYEPNGTVTRAQIAAFVYRCSGIDRHLSGWVYAGSPVSKAVLSVYDTSGNQILSADALATNEYGSILSGEIKNLPSDFRITAEGGTLDGEEFVGMLSADIRRFNPYADTIYINLATTIVSAYLDKYPNACLAEASIVVKNFLEIPESLELASGTQLSNEYFNNAQFLREANENGGINPFIEKLLAEIDASGTHPFQEPLPPQGGAASWLAKTLAEGAVSYVGGELMGWGLDKAGISFGDEDHTAEELSKIREGMADMKAEMTKMSIQLDAISNKLDNIVSQLKDMLKQISHKMALDEYGTRVGQLNSLVSSVDSIQRDLNNFVNNPPSNAEVQRQSLINRIERNIIDQADVIHNQLVGIGGQKPLITLWREIVYENRYLDSEDYDKVEAQYDYFKQYQDSILLLQVEYYHATEGTPGENAAAIMNCIERYEEHIEQQKKLLAQPIEKYTVVDTKWDGMYYSENIELGKSNCAFTLKGKTRDQVAMYMSDLARSNYAGFKDWKILDYDSIGALIENHILNRTPWSWSEFLVDQGWPGAKVESGTSVPFYQQGSNPKLVYLFNNNSHFKNIFDYPEAGLKSDGFSMIMVYRGVTAKDYGYEHLKT